MRFIALYCNDPRFRRIDFKDGVNVLLADRMPESTEKSTRNGAGKTTFVEIMRFMLGVDLPSSHFLRATPLFSEWLFSLELTLNNQRTIVHRSVGEQGRVFLGEPGSEREITNKAWREVLSNEFFGLTLTSEKYKPTYPSLLSYFSRRGRDAFSIPFEHFRKQLDWDKQVNNSYLLNLTWQDASQFQVLKDKAEDLKVLRRTIKAGVLPELNVAEGALEAQRVRSHEQLVRAQDSLRYFKVLPEYESIEAEANELTSRLHHLSNDRQRLDLLIENYEASLASEDDIAPDEVIRLYAAANVELGGVVKETLDATQQFFAKLVLQRKEFLASEIASLRSSRDAIGVQIADGDTRRSLLLSHLRGHGALREFEELQARVSEKRAEYDALCERLMMVRRIVEGESQTRLEREQLKLSATQHLDARNAQRDEAIRLFNDNSEALYESPGDLLISIGENGFRFDIKIQRSTSTGVGSMKTLCYDLMLLQKWSYFEHNPSFLIHDSGIFDGVDERQKLLGFARAKLIAEVAKSQYILTMNSDDVPSPLVGASEWDECVIMRLGDASPEQSLLGVQV